MTNFNIDFCTDAIEPMFRWLKKYKDTGVRKESELLDFWSYTIIPLSFCATETKVCPFAE